MTPVLASFADVFGIVAGVLLSLSGLGMILMGVLAMVARSWKGGGGLAGAGLVVLVAGLWLVGVVG